MRKQINLWRNSYCHNNFVRAIKITMVFFMVSMSVSAKSFGQQLTIKMDNVNLKEVFSEIKKQSSYTFVYNEQLVASAKKVSVEVSSGDINKVMKECLKGTKLDYDLRDNVVVIKAQAPPVAKVLKQQDIEGRVIDIKGKPVANATITVKGTSIGVVANADGTFSISVFTDAPDAVLEVSFVGMKRQEFVVKDIKVGVPMVVVLEEENMKIDDIVVTGIFKRKKEGFTGSSVTVKGDQLKNISTTNIAKALATIDPSFRVMDDIMNGSDPNRLPDMRMRGQATLPPGNSGSNSLVSLQGEYDTYPNQPLLMMDGFEITTQTMADLDPDRVASITILKDAAATAIYGSKAANGVIVIETLAPKDGDIHVTYSGSVRVEMPDLADYNLMGAADKLETERRAGLYVNGDLASMRDYQARLREVKRGVDTYWLSKPLRTAVQQRHSIALEGGSLALRYKLYVGLNNTPGVMKGSSRNTQTGTLDLSYRFKNLLLKNSVTVNNATGDNSPYGSFREYTRLNPYLRPFGENGEVTKEMQAWNMMYLGGGSPYSVANPMYNATFNSLNRTTDFSIQNLFKLEYTPIETVKLMADISLRKGTGKSEIFRPAQHTAFQNVTDPSIKGDFGRTQSENLMYQTDFTASYNNDFNSVHTVTANVRLSIQETSSELFGAKVVGFPNDNMDNILFGKRYNENMTGNESTTRSIGVVGTFGYSYDYRYSADFNIRVDGSSQFGSNNRFAPFWSAGLRWNMKRESFLKNVEWVEDLTLRTSYGVTGTQGFPAYQAQQVYSYYNLLKPYLASDATGAELVAMGNPNLKWQQTDTWNVALEASVLKGRITARAEYFEKKTKNSLAQITLAPSIGFSSYPENMGTIQNRGVELNLSFIPYRNTAKQAYWVVSLNGSHNVDKMLKISDALRFMNQQNAANKDSAPLPQYVEGESLTRIWVVKSLGIDPVTGEELFLTRGGDVTGLYNGVDLIPIGNTEPKWQGNINTSFNYKNWGINLNFNYRYGGQIYNTTLVDKIENADLRYNVDRRALDLRWQKPGDKALYKKLTNSISGSQTDKTSRFVMDENTLRMGAIGLTYRQDQSTSKFLERCHISSVKFGFNMEDVLYVSSVKRERGLDYPFARQFSLSLNISF